MIKFNYKKEKATLLVVSMPKTIKDYSLVFLQMFNNVREYPNMFYRIENNSGNSVFITCRPEYKESVKEWIEAFNNTTVQYEEYVDIFIISANYDSKGYDEIYGSDGDVQFYVDLDE